MFIICIVVEMTVTWPDCSHTMVVLSKMLLNVIVLIMQRNPDLWDLMRCVDTYNLYFYGQWSEALTFSLFCVWNNTWVNNNDTGNLRRHGVHYDVPAMIAISVRDGQPQYWIYQL